MRVATRSLSLGLSGPVWLVSFGIFLNSLGYGAVLPFEIIYLHDGRGFGLAVAGLVVGTITGVAVLSGPLAGPLIDRFGARSTLVAAGVGLAAGYAALALAASPGLAFAGSIFCGACLVMLAVGFRQDTAYAALLAAVIAVGIGECCYTAALMPLVAELAPASVRGRYMASIAFSWWIGLTLAPTFGAQFLSRSPTATFLAAAVLAALAAVAVLRLERRLPERSRSTPRLGRAGA